MFQQVVKQAKYEELDKRIDSAKRMMTALVVAVGENDSGLSPSEKRWIGDLDIQLEQRNWLSEKQYDGVKRLYRRVT